MFRSPYFPHHKMLCLISHLNGRRRIRSDEAAKNHTSLPSLEGPCRTRGKTQLRQACVAFLLQTSSCRRKSFGVPVRITYGILLYITIIRKSLQEGIPQHLNYVIISPASWAVSLPEANTNPVPGVAHGDRQGTELINDRKQIVRYSSPR